MHNVTLRPYRSGDLDALHALDVACFAEPFRFSRAMVRRSVEAKNALVVMAEGKPEREAAGEGDRDGEIVGFAVLHVERVRGEAEKVGYVVTLDVAEPARRLGVARAMMAELERQAREVGCGFVWLHVFTGNAAAITFYERLGFERTGEARDFYAPGLGAWVYAKRLRESTG